MVLSGTLQLFLLEPTSNIETIESNMCRHLNRIAEGIKYPMSILRHFHETMQGKRIKQAGEDRESSVMMLANEQVHILNTVPVARLLK